jgi:hypothetical protein
VLLGTGDGHINQVPVCIQKLVRATIVLWQADHITKAEVVIYENIVKLQTLGRMSCGEYNSVEFVDIARFEITLPRSPVRHPCFLDFVKKIHNTLAPIPVVEVSR